MKKSGCKPPGEPVRQKAAKSGILNTFVPSLYKKCANYSNVRQRLSSGPLSDTRPAALSTSPYILSSFFGSRKAWSNWYKTGTKENPMFKFCTSCCSFSPSSCPIPFHFRRFIFRGGIFVRLFKICTSCPAPISRFCIAFGNCPDYFAVLTQRFVVIISLSQ